MSRGFSTLELLLALMLITTTLAAVCIAVMHIPEMLADERLQASAIGTAYERLQGTIQRSTYDFDSLGSRATTTENGVSVSVTVTPLDDEYLKLITSFASWYDENQTYRSVSFTGIMHDIEHPSESCDDVLIGDWTHPIERTYSFDTYGLAGADTPSSSHPVTSLFVASSTLIASVSAAVARADPTVFIFDISSSTNPLFIASIDNASSTRGGVSGEVAENGLIYLANAVTPNFSTCKQGTGCSQLEILATADSSSPVIITNYQLSTTSAPFATGLGGQAAAKSIAIAGNTVYLGLSKISSASGEEFNIIDVSDPLHPMWLGGYHLGRSITHIRIDGSTAFISTDDPSDELIALSVRDPQHIYIEAEYNAPGTNGFGYGKDVTETNGLVLLGRTYVPHGPELAILADASTSPALIGSESFTGISATSTEGLLVRGFLAFVVTDTSLLFLDIADPSHIGSYADPFIFGSSNGTSIACSRNTVYATSDNPLTHVGYLTIVTSS